MTRANRAVRERLVRPMPDDGLWGWGAPLLIAAFAGILRFWRLGTPKAFIFDETYYAKDAWSLLHFGVEQNYVSTVKDPNLANERILAGNLNDIFAGSGARRRAPAGRQVGHRDRRMAVRHEPVRLALHGGRDRHPRGADDRAHRSPAVPLHVARLHRGGAALGRRHGVRPQPHRAARPAADVLGARGVRRPARRPRRCARAAGGDGSTT